MHLDEAARRFELQLQADGRSPHTIQQYRRHLGLLGTWLKAERHPADLAQLSHEQLALFLVSDLATRSAAGGVKKPTSLNALRSSLRAFLAYAHAAGYLPRNPAALLRRARVGPRRPRSLSAPEAGRLLESLGAGEGHPDARDAGMFALMLETGLRLSSALAVAVEDLDLTRGRVFVRFSKGDRQQEVLVSPRLAGLLGALVGGKTSGPLFEGPVGRSISARHAQRRFKAWVAKAGLAQRGGPHVLRHSFATLLYQQTKDILTVQRALGHASVGSTMVYVR